MEETSIAAGKDAKGTGLKAQADPYYLNAWSLDSTGTKKQEGLYYFDLHQPLFYEFPLPEGKFTAEYIDPWEMKISPISGTFEGNAKIKLTGRPYQALRFRRVG